MAIDRAAPAVLHPVDQRRFHPLAAIGEHGIGRDHLEQRGFLRAQRIGQERLKPVIDAEAFGIARDGVHRDFLRDTDRHQVPRLFDPGAHRRRAIILVRSVLGPPEALRRIDLNRRVDHDRGGRKTRIERGGIDEGLERGPRLPHRLCRAVEDRGLIGETALHRDDAAGIDVHRHEAALHLWHLTQGPALEAAVVARHRPDQNHIADRDEIARDLGLLAQPPVGLPLARPGHVLGRDPVAVLVVADPLDPDPRGFLADLQHHGGQPPRHVARHIDGTQRRAPCVLVRKIFGLQHLAGAAPDALAAVVFLQRLLQGGGGGHLHFRVLGRPDRQPAAEKLVLTEAFRQLPPDLVGEIVARRQVRLERGEIAALHRLQRRGDGGVIGGLVQIAVLPHLAQHIVAPRNGGVVVLDRMVAVGRLG